VKVFVDTNVFVYARDLTEPDKQEAARGWIDHLWDTGMGRVSVQVLNELYVTLTRKLDPGLPASEARADVIDLATWRPVELTPS
jgi:predicted nucleic acid-binding protein